MAKLKDIIDILQRVAPPSLALSFDNAGLNIGEKDSEITGITVCLDATEEVISEAVKNGTNLIISHHPIIFSPIKNLNCDYENYRAVTSAIKNGINIYSMHTNLDCVEGGVNDAFANLLGLVNKQVLDEVGQNAGIGRVGDITETTVEKLAELISRRLDFPTRIVSFKGRDNTVKRVAVVNGSGADVEYIKKAKEMGATCFVTSEIKHHVALFAMSEGVDMIESGHYATERFYIPVLAQKITDEIEKMGYNIKINVSQKERSPFVD